MSGNEQNRRNKIIKFRTLRILRKTENPQKLSGICKKKRGILKFFSQIILKNCANFRMNEGHTHFFYRQLDFSSEPGVANEILENEPKSCLTVA